MTASIQRVWLKSRSPPLAVVPNRSLTIFFAWHNECDNDQM